MGLIFNQSSQDLRFARFICEKGLSTRHLLLSNITRIEMLLLLVDIDCHYSRRFGVLQHHEGVLPLGSRSKREVCCCYSSNRCIKSVAKSSKKAFVVR